MTETKEPKQREGLFRVAPKPEMLRSEPLFEYPIPLEETTDFITPRDRLFTLAHLGIPNIDTANWCLEIGGLVKTTTSFRYKDLTRLESISLQTIHQCAGNPLDPTNPTRTIANVEWRGVLLRDILKKAVLAPGCNYIWAYGLDHGEFAIPSYSSPHQEHYVKDLPIDYVMEEDVLVATHINGEPLSPNHGYPARIVAPGYYGNNSVKWLCRIDAAARRADGFFTKELYNDPGDREGETKPVWEIAPESLIVRPVNDKSIPEKEVTIWGWAWSSEEIVNVAVSTDGGSSWRAANVAPREHASWQRFEIPWKPGGSGQYEIISRAEDLAGRCQPMTGARNAVHKITIDVCEE